MLSRPPKKWMQYLRPNVKVIEMDEEEVLVMEWSLKFREEPNEVNISVVRNHVDMQVKRRMRIELCFDDRGLHLSTVYKNRLIIFAAPKNRVYEFDLDKMKPMTLSVIDLRMDTSIKTLARRRNIVALVGTLRSYLVDLDQLYCSVHMHASLLE